MENYKLHDYAHQLPTAFGEYARLGCRAVRPRRALGVGTFFYAESVWSLDIF